MSSHDVYYNGRLGRVWVHTLLFVLALGGCGGGVDSGGTGAPAKSASASGPISGFGSVIVTGVHFDDSNVAITDTDGTVHSRDELKLGMTTAIRGSAVVVDSNGARSTAASIVFGSAILGPIDNIDTLAKTLVVLGQTVDVTPTTVFDSSLNGGLVALSVGDVIEVYALFDASHYSATRIERKTGFPAYWLRGVVRNLDTATKAFNIGSERISYAGIPASEVPAALANGRFVRAQLQIAPPGGPWLAIRLQDGVRPLEDRDETRVEGLISDFTSSTQFNVDGVSVDASQANVTGSTALRLGVRVAVTGTASRGVLVASAVQTKTKTDVENEGFELDGSIITPIDFANKTFVLRGVTVYYSDNVFANGTISDLMVGKRVEVKGTLSADSTGLQAIRIRFEL